jgi:cytochrome c553
MKHCPSLPAALVVLLALIPGAPSAADAPPKALACQACHGEQGISTAQDIPNLAGQKASYLAAQLAAFRDGARKNALMAAVARQLDPDEIKALAAYWSALPGVSSAAAAAMPNPAMASRMQMPANFPVGFTEYTREVDTNARQVVVRYANAVATQAARDGKPLPEGSVLISATYAALADAQGKPVADAQGRLQPGRHLSSSGMETQPGWGDTIPGVLRNGNWNYGLWTAAGQSRLGELQPRCLACHQPKAADSYVFTLQALRASKP